jgi:hypothetical protein
MVGRLRRWWLVDVVLNLEFVDPIGGLVDSYPVNRLVRKPPIFTD